MTPLEEAHAHRRRTLKATIDHRASCYSCSPMRSGKGLPGCSVGRTLYDMAREAMLMRDRMAAEQHDADGEGTP